MNVTRSPFRILAFVTALLVVLPSVASPRAQYFCHMSRRIMTSSCCAAEAHDRAARVSTSEAQVLSNCCERLAPAKHSMLGKASEAVERLPASGFVAALWGRPADALLTRAPPDGETSMARSARAPPALGPPLFIANCALLI